MTNQQAGRLAWEAGQTAENLAEASFDYYMRLEAASWIKCYPASRTAWNRGTHRRETFLIPHEGPPDYHISLRGGRSLWIEVKTWKAKDRELYRERLFQYRKMMESYQLGGWGGYLVLWRWNGNEEWRFYPVQLLQLHDGGLVFERERGCFVDSQHGWPEWWPALQSLSGDQRR